MPFFDDSGPRPEEETSPLWRAFALVKDQLEQVLLVNLLWALQSVPLLLAFAFPEWPVGLRLVLTLYSALMLAPATAALFALLADLSEGRPLEMERIREQFQASLRPAFLKFLPLLSLFYWLALLTGLAAAQGWLLLETLTRLAFLLVLVFAMSWGPLLVYRPDLSAAGIFRLSILRFWRLPAPTLGTGLACLLALALGLISVVGWFLVVPALIALFQIQLYQAYPLRERQMTPARKENA